MLQAAFFDMDGTLIDRELLIGRCFSEVALSAGLHLTPEQEQSLYGRSWRDVHQELNIEHLLGWDVNELVDQVNARAQDHLREGESAALVPGALELLDDLRSSNVTIAIVTGSLRREAQNALQESGIWPMVDFLFGSEDYPFGKPHPSSYLTAVNTLRDAGKFHDDHIPMFAGIVFEDSVHGISAGQAAHLPVVAVTAAGPPPGEPGYQDVTAADHIITDFQQVTTQHINEWLLDLSAQHTNAH